MPPTGRSNSSDKEYLAVGFGLCALDYIFVVKKFPRPDEKLDATDFSLQGGGPVPTALCTLGRLGCKTAFIGRWGNDHAGKIIRGELEKFGVETDAMALDDVRSAQAFICVDSSDGSRSVILDRTGTTDVRPAELSARLLQSCKYLLIDGRESEAAVAAAKIARECGAEVVLDVGSPRKLADPLLSLVDHLVVSKSFATKFSNEQDPIKATMKLRDMGFKTVVVTLGENGAIWSEGGEPYHQQAFKTSVVDTTGAGDVFHGAFIYGLSKSWHMKSIVEFSCAAAALKCRHIGGRLGIPSLEEVRRILKEHGGRCVK